VRDRRLTITTSLLAVALLALAAVAGWARVHNSVLRVVGAARNQEPAAQQAPAAAPVPASDHVRRGLLKPSLRESLRALGDRLEKPGKERQMITGTIQRDGDAQPHQVSLILETRGRLRVEESGDAHGSAVFVFDRNHTTARTLTPAEIALVETFLYDTPESFFTLQEAGAPTRPLGNGFHLDDAPNSPRYDVYEAYDPSAAGDPSGTATKLYCFNRDTFMLERIRYERATATGTTAVEVRLEDWGDFSGQKLPRHIVRLENGQPLLTVTVDTATFAPRGDGTAFASSVQ
jgi:hypothetical protein